MLKIPKMANICYIILIINSIVTFYIGPNYEHIIFSMLFYLISSQIHLCLHEIGHFIGGYLTGYRLLYIQMLIFCVEKRAIGNYNFSISKSVKGKCIMIPRIKKNGDTPYFWYNAGGLILNFLFGITGLILSSMYNDFLAIFFLQMAFAGIFKFSINIIPHKNYNLTDGYVLKTLYQNPHVRLDYCKYLELFAQYYLDEKIQLNDYTYVREPKYTGDDLIFYSETKKILQLVNRRDETNAK